jgi:D-alanyl-D-alanine carboxypeptidase (penicillin-binding protein 5/6)
MGLVTGETLTVRDLMYGLLVSSGNDAAVALAEHVAGSEDDFVALMNQTAAELGLRATRFASVHGLDAPGQTSSAADLAIMARAALKYPLFEHAVALSTAQVAGHELTNTNALLGSYPGADGIKTGTTDAAGECLVASVTRGGHRLLAIVLGSGDRYADVRALLDYAAAGWRWRSTALPNDALAWAIGSDGALYRLRSVESSDVFMPVWQWRLTQPVRRLDATAPLTGTLPVGELSWRMGGQGVASAPLLPWQAP